MRTGKGYINSNVAKISTANCIAIDDLPTPVTGDNSASIYRLTIINVQPCTFQIVKNGRVVSTAYVPPNVGWHMDGLNGDERIDNVKIIEAGITYTYQGGYEFNTSNL